MFAEGPGGSVWTKAVLPTIVGVTLLVFALIVGLRTRAFLKRADSATGIVDHLNAGGSHPEIEFTTPAGIRISYPQGGFIFGYKPGRGVRVLFEPHDPAGTARIDAIGALWFDSIGLAFIGVVALVIGLTGLVAHPSNRR